MYENIHQHLYLHTHLSKEQLKKIDAIVKVKHNTIVDLINYLAVELLINDENFTIRNFCQLTPEKYHQISQSFSVNTAPNNKETIDLKIPVIEPVLQDHMLDWEDFVISMNLTNEPVDKLIDKLLSAVLNNEQYLTIKVDDPTSFKNAHGAFNLNKTIKIYLANKVRGD